IISSLNSSNSFSPSSSDTSLSKMNLKITVGTIILKIISTLSDITTRLKSWLLTLVLATVNARDNVTAPCTPPKEKIQPARLSILNLILPYIYRTITLDKYKIAPKVIQIHEL